MSNTNAHKVGLVIGGAFAVVHTVWVLMVLTGVAKPLLNFAMGLHFMNFQYDVLPFSWGSALTLIVVTGIIGYLVGCVLGFLWNKVHGASRA